MREVASEVVVARAAAVRVVAARAAVVKAAAAKEASMAAMERAVVGRVEVAKKVASEMTARAAAARLAARAAAVEEPVRAAAGVVAHLERHCACAACLCASSGASQRHDAPHLLMLDRGVGSGRGLIRIGIIWAASTPRGGQYTLKGARCGPAGGAPAHADEVRRWPQKKAGGTR